MRSISAPTLFTVALACQRVAASWGGAKFFPNVDNVDNTDCTEEMSNGYNFEELPLGEVDTFDAVKLIKFECKEGVGKLSKRAVRKMMRSA